MKAFVLCLIGAAIVDAFALGISVSAFITGAILFGLGTVSGIAIK